MDQSQKICPYSNRIHLSTTPTIFVKNFLRNLEAIVSFAVNNWKLHENSHCTCASYAITDSDREGHSSIFYKSMYIF